MFKPRKDELAVIRAFGTTVNVSRLKTEGPELFGKRPFRGLFQIINRIYDYFFFRKAGRHDECLKISLSKGVVDRIVQDEQGATRLRKVGEISKG